MKNKKQDVQADQSLYSFNYIDFSVKRNLDFKTLILKIVLIIIYVAIPVFIFTKAWYLGAFMVLGVAIAWYLTWPYTNVEYEYVLSSGNWQFKKKYGSRKSVLLLEKRVSEMKIIAPYKEEYSNPYQQSKKVYDLRKMLKQKKTCILRFLKKTEKT